MTANPLDSFNLKYLQPAGLGGSLPAFGTNNPASVTPADMGMGLFNMPAASNNFKFDTGALFNPDNKIVNSQGMDFAKMFAQVSNLQNQYMKNMYAPLFNLSFMKRMNQNSNIRTNNPSGYGNYNFDVTQKYNGTAEDLDKNLKGVLAGKGAKLIELQNKYGINAAFLAGLVNTESAHGNSDAAKNKNNVAGIMTKESGCMKLAEFSSVDECLESLARNLSTNYVGQGLTTISQIHQKYCPIGANNDPTGMNHNWGSVVSQLTDKYQMA